MAARDDLEIIAELVSFHIFAFVRFSVFVLSPFTHSSIYMIGGEIITY